MGWFTDEDGRETRYDPKVRDTYLEGLEQRAREERERKEKEKRDRERLDRR